MSWAHVHLVVNHLPVVGGVFALGLLVYLPLHPSLVPLVCLDALDYYEGALFCGEALKDVVPDRDVV